MIHTKECGDMYEARIPSDAEGAIISISQKLNLLAADVEFLKSSINSLEANVSGLRKGCLFWQTIYEYLPVFGWIIFIAFIFGLIVDDTNIVRNIIHIFK